MCDASSASAAEPRAIIGNLETHGGARVSLGRELRRASAVFSLSKNAASPGEYAVKSVRGAVVEYAAATVTRRAPAMRARVAVGDYCTFADGALARVRRIYADAGAAWCDVDTAYEARAGARLLCERPVAGTERRRMASIVGRAFVVGMPPFVERVAARGVESFVRAHCVVVGALLARSAAVYAVCERAGVGAERLDNAETHNCEGRRARLPWAQVGWALLTECEGEARAGDAPGSVVFRRLTRWAGALLLGDAGYVRWHRQEAARARGDVPCSKCQSRAVAGFAGSCAACCEAFAPVRPFCVRLARLMRRVARNASTDAPGFDEWYAKLLFAVQSLVLRKRAAEATQPPRKRRKRI